MSGLLYFLAFPGMDLWPLSFVALAPAMVAFRGQSPRRGALLGWVMGLVAGVLGFHWLLGMLETFSGFPVALCALFMLILCAFQAGCFALLGWVATAGAKNGWGAGVAFGLALIASETLFPLLFPFTFAATVHQVPVLIQTAELGGPLAVALPLVAFNWALAEAWFAWRAGSKDRRRWGRIGALALVPALTALYGVVRIGQVEDAVRAAEKVRVGLVQANMGLLEKRNDRNEGLRRHLTLTKRLREQDKVDLVVWSETSVAGATREEDADAHYRRTVTRRLGVPAIVGAVLVREVPDARKYVLFNSALLTDAKGHVVGRYDKQFLLAFGEYLPLGDTFPILYEWSPNSGKFTPGTSYEPLRLGNHSIATFICYEDIIPSFVNRIMKNGEAQLLVNMTNDAWFGDTIEPWQHMALSKLRSVEQRRFFIRSTNSGVSAIVDPVGRVMSQTGTFEQATLAEEVAWLDLRTPFQIWGTWPWWGLSAAALFVAFKRRPSQAAASS
jgi:apolipoprotein N-acyltransferase